MNLLKQRRYWLFLAVIGLFALVSVPACTGDDNPTPSSGNLVTTASADSGIPTASTLLSDEEAEQRVAAAISSCASIIDTSRGLFCTIEALADHCEHDFDRDQIENCKGEVWEEFRGE